MTKYFEALQLLITYTSAEIKSAKVFVVHCDLTKLLRFLPHPMFHQHRNLVLKAHQLPQHQQCVSSLLFLDRVQQHFVFFRTCCSYVFYKIRSKTTEYVCTSSSNFETAAIVIADQNYIKCIFIHLENY